MNENTYEAPSMTVLGEVADLTQGGATGSHLDAAYPDGTPAFGIFS